MCVNKIINKKVLIKIIDTITLSHKLTGDNASDDYHKIKRCLRSCFSTYKTDYGYASNAFSNSGVLHVELFKHDKSAYYIKISVNPKYMLDPLNYDHVELATEEDYESFEEKFNRFISEILNKPAAVNLPKLKYWSVQRIDYAVNVFDQPIHLYMFLFNKGNVPPNAKLRCELMDCLLYKNSYYRPYGSFTINFYDKTAQLLATKAIITKQYTMRLEVQLHLKNKKYISGLLGLEENSNIYLKDLWRKDFAYRTLYYYITSIVGEEDFYHKNEVISKIRFSGCDESKHKAIEFVELLSKNKRYYQLAKSKLLKKYNFYHTNYFKDNINPIFKAVSVNPITIPSNYQIQSLANPIKFLQVLKDS